MVEDLKRKSAKVKQHPTPQKKAAEAAAAAKGPPNEKAAGAKGKQVDKIKEAKSKKPEPNSFLSLLRAEIQKVMPKTLDDTQKFMKGGDAGALKSGLKGNVSQQKQAAAGDTAKASKQPPSQAGIPSKQEQPIPAEAAPPNPDVPGGEAMPAPTPDAEVSMQDSKQDTEAAMADAEVTDTQLKKANDPRFSAVLSAKDSVAKQADAAPGQYRTKEKSTLTAAVAGAKAASRAGAAAMLGVKSKSKSNVLTRQQAAKAKDEAERKKVSDTIEGIYNKAKEQVEAKLAALDEEVNTQFDSGTDAALAAMKAYTEARIDAYKDERYSGVIGKGRWLRDQFKGLPEAANVFYVEGRNLFTRMMDVVIVRVSNLVEKRLAEAKKIVSDGQQQIKTYVDSLPKNLKAVGQAAQKEVAGRFAELERGIEDKKNQLAQSLAQKYKEAGEKADKALKEIQDANKGLVQKFVEKLGEIIKIIMEFKGKLMAVLRKGWEVIKGILADPIGFLGNLIGALKQGFNQFKANIGKWLIKGIIGWLFGALAEAGVTSPADFSLPSILKLVLQILGITYERMRAKAVKILGPTAVGVIEKLVDYIKTLITGGPAALWEQVKGDLANLKEQVLGEIRTMIITEVVKAAVLKIVSMFNPAGAFVQAVLAIYNTVMFVVEQASRIAALVSSVVDSVSAIASGAIGAAANKIEQSLGAAIPIVIGFLARLVGVGGLPKKATATVKKVQAAVDGAIDKVIARATKFVKGFFAKLKGTGKNDERTPAQKEKDLKQALAESDALLANESLTAKEISKKLPAIKKKYRLVSLEVVVASQTGEEETDFVQGQINPGGKTKSHKKAKPPTAADLAAAQSKADAKKWTKGVEYDEIKVAESGSKNKRIFAFKGGAKFAHYIVANGSWNPVRSQKDKEEIKQAEADLLALLKGEMPGWVSTFDETKSSDAPGSDAAGLGKVAPEPVNPDEDTRVVTGSAAGTTRAVFGEAKYSGAKGKGRYFQLKDFTSITSVFAKRIGDMRKEAAKQKKLRSFTTALKSGNVTVVIYMAGKAQISDATIAKLKTNIKTRVRNYIKSKYPKVKIEEVAGNIEVRIITSG
ncbi:MAG TPA: hypothetical protein VGW12_13980 [Pyrinomonadaceae bacterium]|nr:hypothetical protein [Pyrinomonadaceae bacterium]